MTATEDLEAERGDEEFTFLLAGEGEEGAGHTVPHPSSFEWTCIARAHRDTGYFIHQMLDGLNISPNDADAVRDAWYRHHGLGRPGQIDRLVFMLDHYRWEIEFDLMGIPGCPSLAELWRDRRVLFLLNVIDRLPPNCYTNAAVSKNEKHVQLMVDAGLKPAKGVSGVFYGSVEQRLDTAIDSMNRVGDLLIAVNATKGRRTPPTPRQPRPANSFGKLRHEKRLEQHKALTARLLPNGAQPAPKAARVAGGRRRDHRLLDGTAVVAAGGKQAFVAPGKPVEAATREEQRAERWAARAKEVGTVLPKDMQPRNDS